MAAGRASTKAAGVVIDDAAVTPSYVTDFTPDRELPVIARIAKEMGILTVAIVTRPFKFEGPKRLRVAEEGIGKLAERVDGMIVVNNEKLLTAVDKKVSFREAFLIADRVLYYGVKGISDVINVEGMINLDFADVRNMLSNSGTVLMGIGAGRGAFPGKTLKAEDEFDFRFRDLGLEKAAGVQPAR